MGRETVNVNAGPAFIADHASIRRVPGGRQIDWANVGNEYRTTPGNAAVTIVVGVAGAAANDTAVPVAAISAAIPSGTTIDLGGKKFIRLTANAAAGATSLTVAAIPTALVSGDTGTYAGTAGSGNKVLKAGTPVGDLLASGKVSPRIVTTNPAIGLLESDAVENDKTAAVSGYGIINGGNVYENLLPSAWLSGTPKVLATAVRNELNGAGVGSFAWFQYVDTR